MTEQISVRALVGGGYGDFWRTKKRYRVCKGSRGSKKSTTTALDYILGIMAHPEANALVVRNTGATLRDSCFAMLKWAIHRLKVDEYWKCTTSPLEMVYIPTGQKILFRGFDDPLKITSITVDTGVLCWVWIEEAYEIASEADFNKLDLSIRGQMPDGLYKQITLTFNPWSEQSWLKSRFFDNPSSNVFTKTTTYQCNEWLDESDLEIFEEMKVNNPRRYRIEGLGEWGIAEGLIYENVEYRNFNIDEIKKKAGVVGAYGLDFGYTDPNAFVAMLIDNNDSTIYIFDEFYEKGITNREIAEKIKTLGYGSELIICDSAEPKSIAELRALGIRAQPSRKGADSVNHGIKLIQNYKIVVHSRCVEFWHEICNYCWQKDKFDKPIDKPDHEFSHGMDAMRYGCARVLRGKTFSFD